MGEPKSVQILLSAPQFGGGDGGALQTRMQSFAEETLGRRQRDGRECHAPHGVAVPCSPWRIEVNCDALTSRGTVAVVCTHLLTEPEFPALKPNIQYSAFSAKSCDKDLR